MKKAMVMGAMLLTLAQTSWAMEGMEHNKSHEAEKTSKQMASESKSKSMANMFLVKKEIDGYTVSFHVMPASAGMQHGGSHNLMVKIEKNGELEKKALINSKVFLPNNTTSSKMLMKMGDWYMAGYDLDDDAQSGIMILFKTEDGKKHRASVYYPKAK